jgi:hypothetical protein
VQNATGIDEGLAYQVLELNNSGENAPSNLNARLWVTDADNNPIETIKVSAGETTAANMNIHYELSGGKADVLLDVQDAKGNSFKHWSFGGVQAPYYWGKPAAIFDFRLPIADLNQKSQIENQKLGPDPALYLWQDADGWHVHIAASTVAHKYEGTIITDGALSGAAKTLAISYTGTEAQDTHFKVDGGTFLLMTLMIDGKFIDTNFNVGKYIYVGMQAKRPSQLPLQLKLEKTSGQVTAVWDGTDGTSYLPDGEYQIVARAFDQKSGGYAAATTTINYSSPGGVRSFKLIGPEAFDSSRGEAPALAISLLKPAYCLVQLVNKSTGIAYPYGKEAVYILASKAERTLKLKPLGINLPPGQYRAELIWADVPFTAESMKTNPNIRKAGSQ